MGLGDADGHACATGDRAAARRSGHHRMDRSLKGVRKQYRRVSGMQLLDGGRTPVPGGMQGGRNIHARRQRRRRQHPTVRPPVPVVAPPRQPDGPLAGRRARCERPVGSLRPGACQMPADPRQPSRHYRHVAHDRRRRRARPDPRIVRCRHVPVPYRLRCDQCVKHGNLEDWIEWGRLRLGRRCCIVRVCAQRRDRGVKSTL